MQERTLAWSSGNGKEREDQPTSSHQGINPVAEPQEHASPEERGGICSDSGSQPKTSGTQEVVIEVL